MYGNKRKRRYHFLAVAAGPSIFLLTLLFLQSFFTFQGAAALGTMFWMVIWWILRPVNISVTSLLPIAVNGLFNLLPMEGIISQYFSEIIVLLFGADLVCLTWSTTGLDKRMAIKILCCIGPSLKQQIRVWLILSTVMSIFLPNVVVCTIMVPVAVSMLQFLGEGNIRSSRVALPILLAIVWGAGIGGFGSPLGGAANLVAINYLEQLTGKEFMYIDWLSRFLPFLFLIMLLNLFFLERIPVPSQQLGETKQYFSKLYAELGKMKDGEKISLILFLAAMLLSFSRPLFADIFPALKPAYIFLICGFMTFLFEDENGKSLLSWEQAEHGVMWGMYFLFAGGLALGKMVTDTGAAAKMAELITILPLSGGLETIFVFNVFSCLLTEISSNTAAAAIAVPVVQNIAQALALNPVPYIMISIVAFNTAYILPVSIRAIPVSYGLDPSHLFRYGMILSLSSVLIITIVGYIFMTFFPAFSLL